MPRLTVSCLRIFLPLFALLAGCDSGGLPGIQGVGCSTSSDCNPGLKCLQYAEPAEGGCRSLGLQCVQPCQTASDCATAGSGFSCSATCGTQPICQPALDASGQ